MREDGVTPAHFAFGSLRRVIAAVATCCVITLLPVQASYAEPKPSVNELKAQADELANQLEQMAEQYNGLRVRLQQSRRAAAVAAANTRRQKRVLESVRKQVGSLAATTYMTGGADPAIAFFGSSDPQALLDQVSTLHYFTVQNDTKARALIQAMQAAQRARKAAEDRTRQVRALRSSLDDKREKVAQLYEKARDKLYKKAPEQATKLPPVAGSGKGAQAVRHALAQLGVPYSWGGGNASGPSRGIAHGAGIKGFDCSGLTLYAYAKVGIKLPHFTGSQWNAGVHISREQLQPGDLVFFYADRHHMGIYIGAGQMVHAPQTGQDVRIESIAGRPWAGAVRVA
jgi:cell wall-associated NlpC family hydrolase